MEVILLPVSVTGLAVFGVGSIIALSGLLAELGFEPNMDTVAELKKVLLFCVSLTFLSAFMLGWSMYLDDLQ